MLCSISGVVPEEPVITKNGHLFEKQLIEKAIADTGRDPITGEELSKDDLIPIKDNKAVKPRPITATSIPGLLTLFHNEWDAVMLEHHELRKQLQQRNQELATALYEHDAAVRVIARLARERDQARQALETLQAAGPQPMANGKRAAEEMEPTERPDPKRVKTDGIPEAIVEELIAQSKELQAGRKQKTYVSETLATAEEVQRMALTSSHPLHKTTQGGILSIDVDPTDPSVVATAGLDHNVHIFSRQVLALLPAADCERRLILFAKVTYSHSRTEKRVLSDLIGHSKRVNAVVFLGGERGATEADTERLLATASSDKLVKLWASTGSKAKCMSTLTQHTDAVTDLSLHAKGRYLASMSADATFCIWDIQEARCMAQIKNPNLVGGYTAGSFHPDGTILGMGTSSNLVKMWEFKANKEVASFEGHANAIRHVSFSENGYQMATTSSEAVKLWDLRKLRNLETLTPFKDLTAATFDGSAAYLAVGGAQVQIYNIVKGKFPELAQLSDTQKGVATLKWGKDAKTLLAGGVDHKLYVYETPTSA